MRIFLFLQIWDLADPEGKGFLDKQVYTRMLRPSGRAGPETPGWPPLHFLPVRTTDVSLDKSAVVKLLKWEDFLYK